MGEIEKYTKIEPADNILICISKRGARLGWFGSIL